MSDYKQEIAIRQKLMLEVQNMFGPRSALIQSTLVLRRPIDGNWQNIINECERLTYLYIDRKRSHDLRARLESITLAD